MRNGREGEKYGVREGTREGKELNQGGKQDWAIGDYTDPHKLEAAALFNAFALELKTWIVLTRHMFVECWHANGLWWTYQDTAKG